MSADPASSANSSSDASPNGKIEQERKRLLSRVNKNGILLFKGARMGNLKYRNSVPQLSAGVIRMIEAEGVNMVLELTAAAVGAMHARKGAKTLTRKDLFIAARDRQMTALKEGIRSRRMQAKNKKRKH